MAITFGQESLIALGSNLGSGAGDPAATLRAALRIFPEFGLQIRRIGRFFATPCFPAGQGPDYVNACAAIRTDLPPVEVLRALHRIEAAFARDRKTRWGSRTLDLDLLAVGERVLPDVAGFRRWHDLLPDTQQIRAPEQLILPHPRLQDRAFVLVPLCDVAPDWHHPVLGRSVAQMTSDLPPAIRAEPMPL